MAASDRIFREGVQQTDVRVLYRSMMAVGTLEGCPETSTAEDARAIARVLAGDRDAFGDLVDRHQGRVRIAAYCLLGNRDLTEDVTQEAFLLAYKSLAQLRQPGQFGAWVSRIARNVALRRGRREARKGPSLEDLKDLSVQLADQRTHEPHETEATAEGRHEVYLKALRLLDGIPEPYRQTVIDKYVNRLSCIEIAKRNGTVVGTVTSRLSRGVGMLREAMERAGLT